MINSLLLLSLTFTALNVLHPKGVTLSTAISFKRPPDSLDASGCLSLLIHYNNAKGAGYLDCTSRGEFTINSVGENLVAMTLPGGADTSTNKRKPTNSKNKAKTMPKKR